MFGVTCGIATSVIGAGLVLLISIVGYVAVPGLIESMIENELVLISDTIQMERFETIPFAQNFTVRAWNISNPDEVIAGAVPVLSEVGPLIYKLYMRRVVEKMEENFIHYRIVLNFEFDAEASYPYTEDMMVTIVNIPYHAILQVAESLYPSLMPALSLGMNGIFGAEFNTPIVTMPIKSLLFEGIQLCQNPGLIGAIACGQVRDIGSDAQNMEVQPDGSIIFSLLRYRNGNPSEVYVVNRGLEDSAELAAIQTYGGLENFLFWVDTDERRGSGPCNMINGTDTGVFAPFIDKDKPLYAINTDICRSVEVRYQFESEYEGIPTLRFAAKEWLLDNNEGCFCLNVTRGITRPNGCLLEGAMEMYTCVGAFLVLSYPHFLYADSRYRNGVIGLNPDEEKHQIFLEIEPTTGTVVRGHKRAQFNIFMRPVSGIAATQNLRTTLTPIVWIEEGMDLPEEFVQEITTKLLMPLNLVSILIPVVIAISALVLVLGLVILVRARRTVTATPTTIPNTMETQTS